MRYQQPSPEILEIKMKLTVQPNQPIWWCPKEYCQSSFYWI